MLFAYGILEPCTEPVETSSGAQDQVTEVRVHNESPTAIGIYHNTC